jgi:hypothetical protein
MFTAGDQRRWAAEPNNAPGFVRMFDAYPYSFTWGDDEATVTRNWYRLDSSHARHAAPPLFRNSF